MTNKTRKYQICSKTVMDTSDPYISFDNDGISNHYYYAKKELDFFNSINRKETLDILLMK